MSDTRPVALVTGASSGIGATFARRLAARGYDLILVARRADRLEALAREVPTECRAVAADLARDEDLARVEAIAAGEPRLEMLVNNAGFGTRGLFFETDLEEQDRMHRVHIIATMRLTRAALNVMTARRRGAVINVSSVAGFLQSAGNISYCATKAWMTSFTVGLAKELQAAGMPVRVQALCPGYTYSEFHDVLKVNRDFIPKSFWMSSEFVVDSSLRALDRNRVVVVPGWRYRALVFLLDWLPQSLVRWIPGRVPGRRKQ